MLSQTFLRAIKQRILSVGLFINCLVLLCKHTGISFDGLQLERPEDKKYGLHLD